jgi:oxygen-independent coproporphyrinogen-3 oxidase
MRCLYIHIPFCLKKCIYCDFLSFNYCSEVAQKYIDTLNKEMNWLDKSLSFDALYIGGGTPTMLSESQLAQLLASILSTVSFNRPFELTVEANPESLSKNKLKLLSSFQTNRLSIGVQSFKSDELQRIGRVHDEIKAIDAYFLAREAGFTNISLDLLYGIPGQTLGSWEATLQKAIQLNPEHLSAYCLTPEQGTRLSALIKKNQLAMPDDEILLAMYETTLDALPSAGFLQYELSNFAQAGFQCAHNFNYWKRGDYYGLGVGAHSFIDNKRFSNLRNIRKYMQRLDSNQRPIELSETIEQDAALYESLFLGLRRVEGVDVADIQSRYGVNLLTAYQAELEELDNAGLVAISPAAIKLTRKGYFLSNEVFVMLKK